MACGSINRGYNSGFILIEVRMETISVIAQCSTPTEGSGSGSGAGLLQLLPPFILMIVVFYFVLIRPQRKKEKERIGMIDALEKGDKIVTNAGICGSVVSMKDQWVYIKVDENADIKLKVLKSSISGPAAAFEREEGKAPEEGGGAK